MTPADLHAAIVARVQERLALAQAASGDHRGTTPDGEHWHWVCSNCDTPVDITPVSILDEILECPSCKSAGTDLCSVEWYVHVFESLGHRSELPHMITHGAEEIRPTDAALIAANDPKWTIDMCTAALRRLERHGIVTVVATGAPFCDWCDDDWPCPEVRDEAAVWGVEVDE